MVNLLFSIFFFTLLLFCAFVAYVQWRLTEDKSIPYYIGYLLCVFGHYFRQFLILEPAVFKIMPPFNPPLAWGTPLSYGASAFYLLFIWQIIAVPGKQPRYLSVLIWVAWLYIIMIGLNLVIQAVFGSDTAEQVHHSTRLLTYFPMLWMSVILFRDAHLRYQKLILMGSVVLTLGFVEAIATGMNIPREDLVSAVICRFQTPWGNFYWYHIKVGIIIDVMLFSWAITLRQQMLSKQGLVSSAENRSISPAIVLPQYDRPKDDFLAQLHDFLDARLSDENLTVDQVSAAVFLSKSQTNRTIKKKTGYTTEQYMLRHRLNRAMNLLLSTNDAISDITLQVGIKSVAHFSNSFKREFGITPSMARLQREEPLLDT